MEDNHMKTLWQEACGATPPGFTHRMRSALMAQRPPRRRTPALAMALGITLLLGSAFALEQLGLLDSLNQALRGSLLPQAQEMVQSNVPFEVKQPKLAHFALEEALYDGHQVYMTIRVRPEDSSKTLLMDRNAQPAWAADYQKTGDEMTGESFAEKALAARQNLVQAWVEEISLAGETHLVSTQASRYEDDSLLYTLSAPAQGEEVKLRLHLLATDVNQPLDEEARGSLDFSLKKSPHIKTFAARTPLDLPLAGLTLSLCEVETTPIASYLSLRYSLSENATPLQAVNMADGIWAHWLDATGRPRENGDLELSLETQADGGVRLMQSFGAMEVTPTDITLSFYNGMTKEHFGQVTLALSPKEDK